MEQELKSFLRISAHLRDLERNVPISEVIESGKVIDKLCLDVSENGMSREALETLLMDVVTHTPRTAGTAFFNQLFGGRRVEATLGELISVLLNNSMYTYKVGGAMIGVEKVMIQKIMSLIGFKKGNGTMAPGGSMTILMAMIMARDAADVGVRKLGITKEMVLYTSEESHYSVPKNASFIGVGRNQIRFIPANESGGMRVDLLEEAILEDRENNRLPFFINATLGTTVLGAVDPLKDIAAVAERNKVWLHVDGAYYGSLIFSKKYKHLTAGVSLADSFSINAHKMFGVPLSCSFIITKHQKALYDSFSNKADYLFQEDEDKDDYNPGKISMQCGRRNDALKFWTLWKAIGTKGLGDTVDHLFSMAEEARAYLASNEDYTLYSFEKSINLCFNYKGVEPRKLCAQLHHEGKLMVGYGAFKGQEFVRLPIVNANNTSEEIQAFFKLLETTAEDLL